MILGMSVAGLLDLPASALEYLKAFNQLLHEYEYHSSHEPGSLSGKPKMVDSISTVLMAEKLFQATKRCPNTSVRRKYRFILLRRNDHKSIQLYIFKSSQYGIILDNIDIAI
jgi:hypothetical protein